MLEPGDYQLYTWENPMGKRELTWNSGEAKNKKDTLVKVKYFYTPKMRKIWPEVGAQ